MAQRLEEAYRLIKRVQRAPTINYMCNDRVPLDLEGTLPLPEIPERHFVSIYLDEKMVDRDLIKSHLHGLAQDFMQQLQAKNFDGLESIAEARFVDKLRDAGENQGSGWFSYEKQDYDPEKVSCIDKLFIQGVGVDRSTNYPEMDYTKNSQLEAHGLRQFVHKYSQGMQDYYY